MTFDVIGYAKVEIMGHRLHFGLVSEVERFGTKMLLVQVPSHVKPHEWVAEYTYSGAAIFCIKTITEAEALEALRQQAEWAAPARVLPVHEDDDIDEDLEENDRRAPDDDEGNDGDKAKRDADDAGIF